MVNIRKATLKDIKQITDIANLLYLKIPDFVWNEENFIKKQIKKGEYFLAENSGKPAGIISLRERKNGMHIETLVVKKEFQSKGIGTKLIEFAKELTRQNNVGNLYAYSFLEYNIADFYLKNGFKKMDYFGHYNDRKYYCFKLKIN